MNNSKKWGWGLLATSVVVNVWGWYTLGLIGLAVPWIPMEIFSYYVATTRITLFTPKLLVLFASTFLTFIGIQSYITSDDIKMDNEAITTTSSAVQMKVLKARMDVVNKTQTYESIDPVYLRTKDKLVAELNELQNKSVKYKGKSLVAGLWESSGQCGTRTSKQRNITKRFSVSCGKIKRVRSSLVTLRSSYNSDAKKQQELSTLATSYASYNDRTQQDAGKNIKRLAVSTVIMLAPIIGIENVEVRASGLADTSLVLLAFLIAVMFSSTVLVAGLGELGIKKSVSKMTEKAQKGGGALQDALRTAKRKRPYAIVRQSNVLGSVDLPEITTVSTTPKSAFAKNLAKTLRAFKEGEKVTRAGIKTHCACGSDAATAIFKTLQHNNLLSDKSEWKHADSKEITVI